MEEENKVVDFDLEIVDGKIILKLSHEGSDAGAEVKVTLNSDRLLDKLEQKIPGDWDKGVIAIIKAALAQIKV